LYKAFHWRYTGKKEYIVKKVFFLLITVLSFPAFCDDIAPPAWILGDWAMEYEREIMELTFHKNDILIDGASVTAMMKEGYVTAYRQTVRNDSFFVRIEYNDGYWWEERFPRPEMTSHYTDQNYEKGKTADLRYLRLR
jgi:hypothetical protein